MSKEKEVFKGLSVELGQFTETDKARRVQQHLALLGVHCNIVFFKDDSSGQRTSHQLGQTDISVKWSTPEIWTNGSYIVMQIAIPAYHSIVKKLTKRQVVDFIQVLWDVYGS